MTGPELEFKGLTSDSRLFNLFLLLIDSIMVDSGGKKVTFFFLQGTSTFVLQNMLFSGCHLAV